MTRYMNVSFVMLAMLMIGVSTPASSADTPRAVQDEQEASEVFKELARRSTLPDADLRALLANCDATQQSMYFCAWRDLIAADRRLNQAVAEQVKLRPNCKLYFEAKTARWSRARDQDCEKSAKAEWTNGSMEPTAKLLCMAAQTEDITKRVQRLHGCGKGKSSAQLPR